MAYRAEQNGDVVISGFEEGIGDSPYSGLSDCRNMNLISVPGEASVNFATANITSGLAIGTIASATGTACTFTSSVPLENYMAIYFTGTASYSGFTQATPYWIDNIDSGAGTFALFSDYAKTTVVTPSGTGNANFTTYQIGTPPSFVGGGPTAGGIQQFAQPTNVEPGAGSLKYLTFGVDGVGMVWGNLHTTYAAGSSDNGVGPGVNTPGHWTYTGNSVIDSTATKITNASGGGLVYWRTNDGRAGLNVHIVDYLFVFRNSQIDYMVPQTFSLSGGTPTEQVWTSGWDPSVPSSGNQKYLTTVPGFKGSHYAISSFDGRVYFCDGSNIRKLSQSGNSTPTFKLFDPTDATSFTYLTFNLLPYEDNATCLSPFGTNLLIGGEGKLAYQWNTTSNLVSNYIPIAESYIKNIVTVNTNAYIFAGARGRIYITNGAQANLWKKVPDHLTNTIEPMFQWGGATAVKNQLYFSFRAFNNAGTALGLMGGVWAADLDSRAIRLTNQLSYGTYSGGATALIPKIYNPISSNLQSGTALFMGWFDGVSTYGVDESSANPYTGGQAYLVSDVIPVGTNLQPTTKKQLEFKLAVPLQLGESIELQMSSSLSANTNPTFTSLGTIVGDGSLLSGNLPIAIQKQQWLLVKAISTGTTGTPSFNRLTELRIIP